MILPCILIIHIRHPKRIPTPPNLLLVLKMSRHNGIGFSKNVKQEILDDGLLAPCTNPSNPHETTQSPTPTNAPSSNAITTTITLEETLVIILIDETKKKLKLEMGNKLTTMPYKLLISKISSHQTSLIDLKKPYWRQEKKNEPKNKKETAQKRKKNNDTMEKTNKNAVRTHTLMKLNNTPSLVLNPRNIT